MSYTKTVWTTGDVITQTKARNWEDGIEASYANNNKDICNGRLTLESGVAVSTTDQADKGTLYWTPYEGNQIGLYDGASWNIRTFAELSLSLAGYTASKPYDIWAYDNAGTVALESTIWTSATARATALALQDGVLVKSGTVTRRYLGTIYITAAGAKTSDTFKLRYVWNYYNRVRRPMKLISSGTWNYTTATYRQANNSAVNQFEVVQGVAEDAIDVLLRVRCSGDGANVSSAMVGIDQDSTTAAPATNGNAAYGNVLVGGVTTLTAAFRDTPPIGYHYYAWIEFGNTGTVTWDGVYSAMHGTWKC